MSAEEPECLECSDGREAPDGCPECNDDLAVCEGCDQVRDRSELDDNLTCEDCRDEVEHRRQLMADYRASVL